MAIGAGESVKRAAYIRVATKVDVPVIKLLVDGLAEYERQTEHCHATEAKLESTLFLLPPFVGPTVFLLELESVHSPSPSSQQIQPSTGEDIFEEKHQEVTILADLQDPSSAKFVSSKDESRTVVGFVLFYPSYSTLLSNGGLFIGDLYVREAYRRQRLGTLLLTSVAEQAARKKLGRVEWNVLDWNENAMKFYETMGAILLKEWRVCRLTRDALQAYAP